MHPKFTSYKQHTDFKKEADKYLCKSGTSVKL